MTIQDDIRGLDGPAYNTLRAWLLTEEDTRRANANATAIDGAKAGVIEDLRKAGTIPNPAPPVTVSAATKVTDFPAWKSPGTDHSKMYTYKQRVSRNGKVYESQVQGLNSWEPGGVGVHDTVWRDVTAQVITPPAGTPVADGTQAAPFPFAGGLALTVGQYVTDKGLTYKVIQAHTSAARWAPADVPAMFQKV